MQSESSGTLTAICMLIPLVSVPYFAIRGTQDVTGSLPSLDGSDEVAFASTEGFGDNSNAGDAPPFPSGDSVVVENSTGNAAPSEWTSPFDEAPQSLADAKTAAADAFSEFKNDVSSQLDEQRDRVRSGLGGATVRNGFPQGEPTSRQVPAPHVTGVSHSQPAASAPAANRSERSEVATEWETGISQLKTLGMRNYRVESLRDKSVYYVTAFFPDQSSGVNLRIEGEGPHPLTALRSVLRQASERRGQKTW